MSYLCEKEEEALREFVGSTPTAMWVSPDEHELHVVCGASALVMPTEGACCSECWWADAIGVKQLFGHEVVSAEEIDMPQPANVNDRTRQEEDLVYGFRVRTTDGVCDLIFRNSSNGYYGGEATFHWAQEYEVPEGFRQIVGDWSA